LTVKTDPNRLSTNRAFVSPILDTLFEDFLEGWYQDNSLWPKVLGPELFEKWFAIENHSMVIDTIDEPVLKE
jgi:hypothetical protein